MRSPRHLSATDQPHGMFFFLLEISKKQAFVFRIGSQSRFRQHEAEQVLQEYGQKSIPGQMNTRCRSQW